MSLLYLTNTFLRHRKLFVRLPVALATVTLVVSLVLPRHYTTSSSFTAVGLDPSSLSTSQLSGLAAQFGVSLGGASGAQSPDFFVDLVTNPGFLQHVAATTYVVPTGRDTLRGDFIKLYDIDESTPGETMDEAIHELGTKVVSSQANAETGVISIDVSTKWPALSYQIAQRILALVDSFNVRSNQVQAAAQQRFMGQRVDTARFELRSAETALERFLLANREFRGDPQLSFAYDRLQREVTMRQEVYATLMQSYEQARIEAARNTPSLSLVQEPALPLRSDKRHIALKSLFALIGGGVLASLWVLFQEFLRFIRYEEPGEAERLDHLLAQARPRWLDRKRSAQQRQ